MTFQRRRLPGRPFGMTTVNFCLAFPEDSGALEEEAKGIELGAEDLRWTFVGAIGAGRVDG